MKRKCTLKRLNAVTLATIMATTPMVSFAATDTNGHWAESTINKWENQGMINGYPDGTMRPDTSVTRAELLKMIQNVIGYSSIGSASFSDVHPADWYYECVIAAASSGIVAGFPDGTFAPDDVVTRAQAAVFVANTLGLDGGSVSQYSDASTIPSWAVSAVGAMSDKGYLSGMMDGTFAPNKGLTRAEAMSFLDRVITDPNFATYQANSNTTTASGDYIISRDDTIVTNTTFDGDVIITSAVGDGEVYFNNVVIKGDLKIQGGGNDSIYLKNTTVLGTVIVDYDDVRVQFSEDCDINDIQILSVCTIDSVNLDNQLGTITIDSALSTGTSSMVTINAPVDEIIMNKRAYLYFGPLASVNSLTVESTASSSKINISRYASIDYLTANGTVALTGTGTIGTVRANVSGVTYGSSLNVNSFSTASGVQRPTESGSSSNNDNDDDSGSNNGGSNGGGSNGGSGGTTRPPATDDDTSTEDDTNKPSSYTVAIPTTDGTAKLNDGKVITGTGNITIATELANGNDFGNDATFSWEIISAEGAYATSYTEDGENKFSELISIDNGAATSDITLKIVDTDLYVPTKVTLTLTYNEDSEGSSGDVVTTVEFVIQPRLQTASDIVKLVEADSTGTVDVTLWNDISGTASVAYDGKITLNLNGYTFAGLTVTGSGTVEEIVASIGSSWDIAPMSGSSMAAKSSIATMNNSNINTMSNIAGPSGVASMSYNTVASISGIATMSDIATISGADGTALVITNTSGAYSGDGGVLTALNTTDVASVTANAKVTGMTVEKGDTGVETTIEGGDGNIGELTANDDVVIKAVIDMVILTADVVATLGTDVTITTMTTADGAEVNGDGSVEKLTSTGDLNLGVDVATLTLLCVDDSDRKVLLVIADDVTIEKAFVDSAVTDVSIDVSKSSDGITIKELALAGEVNIEVVVPDGDVSSDDSSENVSTLEGFIPSITNTSDKDVQVTITDDTTGSSGDLADDVVQQKLSTPTDISGATSGANEAEVEITFTVPDGETWYYTTDGTEPNSSDGTAVVGASGGTSETVTLTGATQNDIDTKKLMIIATATDTSSNTVDSEILTHTVTFAAADLTAWTTAVDVHKGIVANADKTYTSESITNYKTALATAMTIDSKTYYNATADTFTTPLGQTAIDEVAGELAKQVVTGVGTDTAFDALEELELESIAVATQPTKTTYGIGDNFDPTGLVITLIYNDTSMNEDITYGTNNASDFTFSPSLTTALAVTDTEVGVTYGGKTTANGVIITVEAIEITNITIKDGAYYNVGQTLEAVIATDEDENEPTGTVTYKWQSCNSSNGTYDDISGATSATYTLASGDENKYIKVVATQKSANAGTTADNVQTSDATIVIKAAQAAAPICNGSAPTEDGDGDDGHIEGLIANTDYEISTDYDPNNPTAEATWEAKTSDGTGNITGLSANIYYVRVPADGDKYIPGAVSESIVVLTESGEDDNGLSETPDLGIEVTNPSAVSLTYNEDDVPTVAQKEEVTTVYKSSDSIDDIDEDETDESFEDVEKDETVQNDESIEVGGDVIEYADETVIYTYEGEEAVYSNGVITLMTGEVISYDKDKYEVVINGTKITLVEIETEVETDEVA